MRTPCHQRGIILSYQHKGTLTRWIAYTTLWLNQLWNWRGAREARRPALPTGWRGPAILLGGRGLDLQERQDIRLWRSRQLGQSAYRYLRQTFLGRSSSSGCLDHTPLISYWIKRNSICYEPQAINYSPRYRTETYMPSSSPGWHLHAIVHTYDQGHEGPMCVAALLGSFKVHSTHIKVPRPRRAYWY